MPEGDTIHRIARGMQRLVGARVEDFVLPRSTQSTDHLIGSRIERIDAAGKNLLVRFEEGWVLRTHLRMYGRWRLRERAGGARAPLLADAVVYLATANYEALCTAAPVVTLARERSMRLDDLHMLGPDLLAPDVDLDAIVRRVATASALPLGEAILRQRLVAGIGNVWKSELLHARGLDPFAPVACFPHDELARLFAHARLVMLENVDGRAGRRALLPGAWKTRVARREARWGEPVLSVYGRAGAPCFACGTPIRRAHQAGRSTYWCPRCQPSRRGTGASP